MSDNCPRVNGLTAFTWGAQNPGGDVVLVLVHALPPAHILFRVSRMQVRAGAWSWPRTPECGLSRYSPASTVGPRIFAAVGHNCWVLEVYLLGNAISLPLQNSV